jgi:hypothetical protein
MAWYGIDGGHKPWFFLAIYILSVCGVLGGGYLEEALVVIVKHVCISESNRCDIRHADTDESNW